MVLPSGLMALILICGKIGNFVQKSPVFEILNFPAINFSKVD
jgi:hypothetical protein